MAEPETETIIFSRAIPIPCPSGGMARPEMRNIKIGKVLRVEAHYFDTRTGAFFRKTTISETRPKTS